MRISEAAERAGATVKAVRYYERLGLVHPERARNGYRMYDDADVAAVRELRRLAGLGIPASRARAFIDCLGTGHEHGDTCPSALAEYRDTIADLDARIAALQDRRRRVADRLIDAAGHGQDEDHRLPTGLPVPLDDGGADHLRGASLPSIVLPSTAGGTVDVSERHDARSVLYFYPLSRRPGVDLPEGWDTIPGARGCTAEACDFRDHAALLRDAGVRSVHGVSSQDREYQRELVDRLSLPFSMLSDADFELADALRLPTISAAGWPRLHARLTLIVRDGRIEHVFYPVFPPDRHAHQVLAWLREHPA